MELDTIYNEDCLEGMKKIPDNSVDCIITDLPYGTIACSWDSTIPFDSLWGGYKRVLKHQGSVLLFGSEPFSTSIRMSNLDWFKYDWIWVKNTSTGFQHAKNMPLKNYEVISVFSAAGMGHKKLLGDNRMTYNPQGIVKVNRISKNTANKWGRIAGNRPSHKDEFITEYENYPLMVLQFDSEPNTVHPTQKPVDLLRYLILTYSNEGDTILDSCMGSGTTAVAAIKEKRHFVGFELNKEYYDIANKRIKAEQAQLTLF